jgi:hypothetical protein
VREAVKSANEAIERADIVISPVFGCAIDGVRPYVAAPGSTVHRCQSGCALP